MDQPITSKDLKQAGESEKINGNQTPDPLSRNGAMSPVLPQRQPRGKKSKRSKNMLGASSRGVGVLREAAASKNHVTNHQEVVQEAQRRASMEQQKKESGEIPAPSGTTGQQQTANPPSSGHSAPQSLPQQATSSAIHSRTVPSSNVAPGLGMPSSTAPSRKQPVPTISTAAPTVQQGQKASSRKQTPRTYDTEIKPQELIPQSQSSDNESQSSKRSIKKKKASKKKKKKATPRKTASSKKSKSTSSSVKKPTTSVTVDVQTETSCQEIASQTKVDGQMMKELLESTAGGVTSLSGIPPGISTSLQQQRGATPSTPSSPNAFSSHSFSARGEQFGQKPSDAFAESVETILEQLMDMYTEVTPDLRHKSEFRSLVMAVTNQIRIKEKMAEEKVNGWKKRYEKLQVQWKKVIDDFDSLFKEKESLREERDSLLCTQKDDLSKRALLQGVRLADSKLIKDFFVTDMQQAVTGIKESLNATYALLWVFNQDTNELQTISIAPQPSEEDPDTLQKIPKPANYSVPCTKDLIGECFQQSQPINLLHSHKEEQHNHLVDILINAHTKTMMCFPLISPKTQTAIGVIQVINKTLLYTKKSNSRFTVDDEERLSQYAFILGRVVDSARDLYSVGRGSRKQYVSSTPRRIGKVAPTREERIEFLKFHGGLLPAHVRNYIVELHNKHSETTELYEQVTSEVKRLKSESKEKDETIQNLKFNQYIFVEQNPKKKSRKTELLKNISDLEKTVKSKKKEVSKINVGLLRQDVQAANQKKRKEDDTETLGVDSNPSGSGTVTRRKGSRRVKRASQSQFVDSPQTRKNIIALEKQLDELSDDEEDNAGTHQTHAFYSSGQAGPYSSKARDDDQPLTRFITKGQKKLIEEQKRKRNHTKYKNVYVDMFAEHPIPLMLLSKYFQVVHVNRSLCEDLECNQDFLIGKLFSTLAPKLSHSSLAQVFQNNVVDDVRIRIGMEEYVMEDEDSSTRIYQLLIRELGFVDTKFKLLNSKVPLEGPLYLVSLISQERLSK